MKVTISNKLDINIEGIEPDEILALIRMIEGAGLEERRIFFQIVRALRNTPLDKMKLSEAVKLAFVVRDMRGYQKALLLDADEVTERQVIAKERKVDDMVNEILNKL